MFTGVPIALSRSSILSFKARNSCISATRSFSSFSIRSRQARSCILFSRIAVSIVRCSSVVENRVELLNAVNDDHGGIIVEMKEPMDSEVFVSKLRVLILQWKQQGKKGVWVKLPIELVNLVEAAVKEGFWYYAEPKYLMLVYWIPEIADTQPSSATHQVRVGAFVTNDKREVLVDQEKGGKWRGTGVWKFPTGVLVEGDDICNAAIRKVKEETGIDTEFVEVLAFSYEKSDLFFMCMLHPLSFDIQKQELEIEAAKWMPFEEYANQSFVQKHEFVKYMSDICLAKKNKEYGGFFPVPTTSSFSSKKFYMYVNSCYLNK